MAELCFYFSRDSPSLLAKLSVPWTLKVVVNSLLSANYLVMPPLSGAPPSSLLGQFVYSSE